MWSGTGERESLIPVVFSEPFKTQPSVFITLELLDLHSSANHRTVTVAENITEKGFDAIVRTWGDTRIARARAAWIAIGEVKGEEDWDIDYGS